MTIKQKYLFIGLSLLAFGYSAHWFFAPDMFFTQDEIILNYWAKRTGVHPFHIFRYNHDDRPIGWLFITLCQTIAGDSYYFQIASIFLIHLTNSALLYLFIRKYYHSVTLALCGAILFACYYPSNSATYYIGAIFDVACCTFLLLSLLCFQNQHTSFKYTVLGILFYYISLRAKEMSILLPFILTLLIYTESNYKFNRNFFIKVVKRTWPYYLILTAFTIAHFQMGLSTHSRPQTDPYYMDFSIRTFITNLNYYLTRITTFDAWYWPTIVITAISCWSLTTQNKKMFFAISSFVLSLTPVLFYKQHTFDLFLYIPHVFFSILVISIVQTFYIQPLKKIDNIFIKRWHEPIVITALIIIVFLSVGPKSSFVAGNRKQQIIRKPLSQLHKYVLKIAHNIVPDTKFYISGMPYVEFNQFSSNWLRINDLLQFTLEDNSIKAYTDNMYPNFKEKYIAEKDPKVFLTYVNNGFVKTTQNK